jgi:PEP-CTERM motif
MNLRAYAFAAIGALALSAGLAVFPAGAAVTSVSSSAGVLDVDLMVLGFPVNFAPLPASGSAPPHYNLNASLPSFSASFAPISLSTGLLTDTASGDTGTGIGSATATIENLDISWDSTLSLTATSISSTSSVNGTPSATGSAALTGLTISVLGFPIAIPVDPTPNDVIFSFGGLTITLNQQISDPSETAGITTNAIALDFDDFPFDSKIVRGSIAIAQSEASIIGSTPSVPEPATWAMLLLGFAGLGYAGYRKSRPTISLDQVLAKAGPG